MTFYWFFHPKKHYPRCSFISCVGRIYKPKIQNSDDWRFARIQTLEYFMQVLKRKIESQELDLLLFPRHCSICYETNSDKLENCKKCNQVWYCRDKSEHLPKSHLDWCEKLELFAKIVRKQALGNLKIANIIYSTKLSENIEVKSNDNMYTVVKKVLDKCDNLDDCATAIASQAASGPLTILHALHSLNYKTKSHFIVHLIGAELHYEGNTLEGWEHFFMHFQPKITDLRIVLVGPELHANTIHETFQLCNKCNENNKSLTFEFINNTLYHEYATSKKFLKPHLVCAFNPGLHRFTGFNQKDTWPKTIKSALKQRCPFVVTAYTSYEAPLDLQRVQECAAVQVLQKPARNPYASLKPDRNFISDHEAPLIFKNYYVTIVSK